MNFREILLTNVLEWVFCEVQIRDPAYPRSYGLGLPGSHNTCRLVGSDAGGRLTAGSGEKVPAMPECLSTHNTHEKRRTVRPSGTGRDRREAPKT
jgi:hypothetical protein